MRERYGRERGGHGFRPNGAGETGRRAACGGAGSAVRSRQEVSSADARARERREPDPEGVKIDPWGRGKTMNESVLNAT